MGNIKIIGCAILVIVLICGMFYGIYQVKRWWNYTWGYEEKVVETVHDIWTMKTCAHIRPEALTDLMLEICKGNEKLGDDLYRARE